ncbi:MULTISPECIES: hypothetical protein [unclassified Streptomyces]
MIRLFGLGSALAAVLLTVSAGLIRLTVSAGLIRLGVRLSWGTR